MKKQQKSTKGSKSAAAASGKKKGDEFDVNSFLFYGGNETREVSGFRNEKGEIETSKINALIGK